MDPVYVHLNVYVYLKLRIGIEERITTSTDVYTMNGTHCFKNKGVVAKRPVTNKTDNHCLPLSSSVIYY